MAILTRECPRCGDTHELQNYEPGAIAPTTWLRVSITGRNPHGDRPALALSDSIGDNGQRTLCPRCYKALTSFAETLFLVYQTFRINPDMDDALGGR